jgi:hypothetical protein
MPVRMPTKTRATATAMPAIAPVGRPPVLLLEALDVELGLAPLQLYLPVTMFEGTLEQANVWVESSVASPSTLCSAGRDMLRRCQ